jgi:hypothetical protein
MAQEPLHELRVVTAGEQQRGARVPQVVESYMVGRVRISITSFLADCGDERTLPLSPANG